MKIRKLIKGIQRLAVVSLAVLFLHTNAFALPVALDNSAVTWADIGALFDLKSAATHSDLFNFLPETPGPDGTIYSAVFSGIGAGAADGLNLYLYQIVVDPCPAASGCDEVSAASFDWTESSTVPSDLTIGGVAANSVYISSGSVPFSGGFPSLGSVAPSGVTLNPVNGSLNASVAVGLGTASYVFGTWSPLEPGLASVPLTDSGSLVAPPNPNALVPVPEPASLILMGSGLAGLALWGRKKKIADQG